MIYLNIQIEFFLYVFITFDVNSFQSTVYIYFWQKFSINFFFYLFIIQDPPFSRAHFKTFREDFPLNCVTPNQEYLHISIRTPNFFLAISSYLPTIFRSFREAIFSQKIDSVFRKSEIFLFVNNYNEFNYEKYQRKPNELLT